MISRPGAARRGETRAVRIWDLPTRLFHWSMVALFAAAWWSAETDRLEWHFRFGYAILALLAFRIFWGFVGSTTARFGSFLKGPRTLFAYARLLPERHGPRSAGHNPIGGWSVAAMLLLLSAQVGLGLFAIDVDGVEGGPFSYLVTFETARRVSGLHERVFNILLALTGLHVAAITFYAVHKRENLVAAMLSGVKSWPPGERPPALRFAGSGLALAGFAGAVLIALWVARAF